MTQLGDRPSVLRMTQPGRYLTADQVAERFGLSAEAVRAWVRAKKIPVVKLPSGRMRFRVEDIEAIEAGEQPIEAAS